ncbi:hypothetical protein BJ875DRAFT_483898 [Amylocarpus encephaloides]|uniref:Uncharacterized protein n=1 Tax=Amylocarpus encephaloides TaxID=45428 RepID=A0A9P8C766_9HELO|nr:hypothetical protein BJ875DRAFT_483898 [Amylocarpus encephaloides]
MDELERLTQSEPGEKAKKSPWVARALAGLISLKHCQIAKRIGHLPTVDYLMRFTPLNELIRNLQPTMKSLAKIGTPKEGRFNYPSHKRRSKETIARMRQSEANLDLFWSTIDREYKRKTGNTLKQTFETLTPQTRPLERTAESLEPQGPVSKKSSNLEETFDTLRLHDAGTSSKFAVAQPKTKLKPRGLAIPSTSTRLNSLEEQGFQSF